MPRSYPVNLSDRYTYFNTDTMSPLMDGLGQLFVDQPWPTSDGFLPQNLNPKIKILTNVVSPTPVAGVDYDPATQTTQLQAPVVDLVEETYTYNWSIINLSQSEIDLLIDISNRSQKLTNVKTSIATLRTWATEANGVTVTSGNAVAVLQTITNRLGIFFDRFADLIEGQHLDK